MVGRRLAELGSVDLELGATLPDVQVAYETWGTPRHDDAGRIVNAVVVLHALTGDAHAAGPVGVDQPTPGWWDALIGPGRALDTDEWFVVSSNVLGGCRGTTGPSSSAPDGRPWGSRFPRITIRDQVAVEVRLADHLGIDRYVAAFGGSMGGMRALEWAVGHSERLGGALVLAVGAAVTADQIGTQTAQTLAIRQDPEWRGGDYYESSGPIRGLGLARRIAQLTYRGEPELDERFGRQPQPGENPLADGRYAAQSYLDHHADKLVRRFDAGSYVVLTEAMNTHDIGRGRGGVAAALASTSVPLTVAGIDSDRLYPLRLQAEIATLSATGGELDVIHSPYGHDAFLIEGDALAALVTRTLATCTAPAVS